MLNVLNFIFSKKFYMPIIYIIIGVIIYSIINKILNNYKNKTKDKRKNTIVNLGNNIVKYMVMIFVVLATLKVFGINISNILASFGILAAVIGLALQDIIKDFLAGISIIFDSKYSVGDIIEINGFKGKVIALELRTTKIQAFTGEVKCIGNSSFNEVINYSLKDTEMYIKLNVAYDTDIDKLEKVLKSLKKDILKIDNVIDYSLLGVDEFDSSSIVYMIYVVCKPMTGFAIKRSILKLIKDKFNKESISIPYTTIDVNLKK